MSSQNAFLTSEVILRILGGLALLMIWHFKPQGRCGGVSYPSVNLPVGSEKGDTCSCDLCGGWVSRLKSGGAVEGWRGGKAVSEHATPVREEVDPQSAGRIADASQHREGVEGTRSCH